MSKEKFFTRPKVRFSQTIDDQNVDDASRKEKTVSRTDGPKIRSIVALERPVKIMSHDAPKISSNSRKTDLDSDEMERNESSKKFDGTVPSNSSSRNDNVESGLKALRDSSNTENIKANSESAELLEHSGASSNKETRKSGFNLVLPEKREKSQTRSKEGKENTKVVLKKNVRSVHSVKKAHEGLKSSLSQKNKGQMTSSNEKKSDMVKMDRQVPRTTKSYPVTQTSTGGRFTASSRRSLNSKSTVTRLMPCLKYARPGTKAKTSPAERTATWDIAGHKIQSNAGPRLSRRRSNSFKVPGTKEDVHLGADLPEYHLEQPQYNSIMCTINKLGELRKQKIVTDVEHLPTVYRNLVNAKISSALDFPLDEAVYKNLVDLSVDEKQLPCRLTRSKDPEPRQRDVVPSLSDFFTPVCNEEYCTSINARPRNPEVMDSWCAFKISEKIIEWKDSMDRA